MEIFSTNISLLLTEIYELVKEFAALHIFYVKYWLCICQCIIYCFNWKKNAIWNILNRTAIL